MRTPPASPTPDELLLVLRDGWGGRPTLLTHLPLGFGAHHWRADYDDGTACFVTLDPLGPRHGDRSLEGAYAAARDVAAELDFVHPCLTTLAGTLVARTAAGALSATVWLSGTPAPDDDATRVETATMVERLHAVAPPAGLPIWTELVPSRLADELAALAATPWTRGLHGETARALIGRHLDAIGRWTRRYHELGAVARERPWVPTHGEPGHHNQLITDERRIWVDWESFKLAPAERDTRVIGEGDDAMLELFDLEWRLDEISHYAAWFAGPHPGSDDDEVALGGLRQELDRPEWRTAPV